MKILTLPIGLYETNCYVIITGGRAVVIDPADSPEYIHETAKKNGAEITAVLLTHGHLDHALGCADLMNACGCSLYVHEADFPMVSDANRAYPRESIMLGRFKPVELCGDGNVSFINDGEQISGLGFKIDVLTAPGHTPGSVMYRLPDEKAVFTGDTIFNMSVGICASEADFRELLNSAKKLMATEEDYTLYPGHGAKTLLSYEKAKNPYLSAL